MLCAAELGGGGAGLQWRSRGASCGVQSVGERSGAGFKREGGCCTASDGEGTASSGCCDVSA